MVQFRLVLSFFVVCDVRLVSGSMSHQPDVCRRLGALMALNSAVVILRETEVS